jgi:hypothetical protein
LGSLGNHFDRPSGPFLKLPGERLLIPEKFA